MVTKTETRQARQEGKVTTPTRHEAWRERRTHNTNQTTFGFGSK